MSADPALVDHARDLFADLGEIRVGRLFGGAALYVGDAMFAMVSGDGIWMKTDASIGADYAAAGSEPFSYATKTGDKVVTSLMRLPESAFEDPAEALGWAQKSLVPARAAAKKRKKT